MSARALVMLSVVVFTWAFPPSARAWVREHARTWAVLPAGSGGPEGLEVGPDGTVYVGSFGFDAQGPLAGTGRIFVYDDSGRLLRTLDVNVTDSAVQSTSHLLGLRWDAAIGKLLAVDFGTARVLAVDAYTGSATAFITLPASIPPANTSLNDITFDAAGNVYVSDSFQGVIWRTGPQGGEASEWIRNDLLTTAGVPPFGANGLRFNNEGTALFVANTGNDTVVKIPVSGGSAGAPSVFVSGVNGADGLVVDADDNLWVAANQEDEIVVVGQDARAIAKLGDFDGLRNGMPRGLLFPASLRFLRNQVLVTNLALDLRLFGLPPAIDSLWAAEVTRYTVAALPANIPARAAITGEGSDGREAHGNR